MKDLALRARHGRKDIRLAGLRRVCRELLDGVLKAGAYDLTVMLVDDEEMTRLNRSILNHEGTTDVITLDLAESTADAAQARTMAVTGVLYVCVPEARRNARDFGVHWTEEVARYIAHGVLHLTGHDDITATQRRVMRKEENRLVAALRERIPPRTMAAARTAP